MRLLPDREEALFAAVLKARGLKRSLHTGVSDASFDPANLAPPQPVFGVFS